MAPNTGQGANCAIEDASALTNLLNRAVRSVPDGRKLSTHQVHALLERFNNDRLHRVRNIYSGARFVVRLHARHSLFLRLLGRYYVPYSGDLPADTASKVIAGAGYLEFLPPSQRWGSGWDRFGSKQHIRVLYIGGITGLLLLLSAMTWFRQDMLPWLLLVS
jgi:2-polyprenyl-6-methoxyphenol hydroxylase-like FAD-dependent oxidoreductase